MMMEAAKKPSTNFGNRSQITPGPTVRSAPSSFSQNIPETTASVDTIGVDPELQHHGVGRVLMEDFARNARVAGVKKIYTRVLWNDLALIRFFDSVGFIPGRMINLELAVD